MVSFSPFIAVEGQLVFAEDAERFLQYKRGLYCLPDNPYYIEQVLKTYYKPALEVQTPYTGSTISQKSIEKLTQFGHLKSTDYGQQVYPAGPLAKMSLPTYPFNLKPYRLAHTKRQLLADQISVNQQGKLQLLEQKWISRANAKPASSTRNNADHHIVFCEVPQLSVTGAKTESLFSSQFTIEQKVADYGFSLVEVLQQRVKSKQPTHFQLVVAHNQGASLYQCFASLLKTASLECPRLTTQLILFNPKYCNADILIDSRDYPHQLVTRYQDKPNATRQSNSQSTKNQRVEVLSYQTIADECSYNPYQPNGVYLITGGLGGIGAILIDDLNQQPFSKTVIATGTKGIDHPDVQQKLAQLQSDNTELKYYQVDVTVKRDVIGLVRQLLSQHQKISGVIHAAGKLKDQLLVNKTQSDFNQV